MRKAKKMVLLLSLLTFFMSLGTPMTANAASDASDVYVPYETYTYSTEKDYYGFLLSPHAYVPDFAIDSHTIGLEVALNNPTDMVVDREGYLYIADTGNNRIVVLDDAYQLVRIISEYVDDAGTVMTFNQPKAVFVNDERNLYIGDTQNGKIVIFDKDGVQLDVFEAPSAELLQNVIFEPSALAVDQYDRMYVISQSSNLGVMTFDANGEFQGFIGAEKTTGSVWDIIKDFFRSDEQKAREVQNVPTQYNNLTIDDKGFIYVTNSSFKAADQVATARTQAGNSNPIKMLNPAGTDVLKRNGARNQGGDLQYADDCSRFIDIALGADGVYTALDQTGAKLFTYDENGNLMYVFGGKGAQLGVFQMPVAVTYRGTDILVLDARIGSVTVFKRTAYGDEFAKALELYGNRKYTEANEQWRKVLELNSNYEPAYSGIGDSYMRLGMYKEAMQSYKNGNDVDGYGEAYTLYRKNLMSKYILLIPIVVILICYLISRASKKLVAVNQAGWEKKGKPKLWEELCYGWYVIFHPFDGFYELKRSKKGGVRGATVILAAAVLEGLYEQIGTGYIMTGTEWARVSILDAFMSIGSLVLLWTASNWAFTTLMDGKGRLKDIYVASCYALIPMVILGFPATLLTNVCTASETQFITFFYSIGAIWTLILIFFGALVTNDYSLLKNILTTIMSMIGMAFIAFVLVLTVNLFVSMYSFIQSLANEIIYRM